MTSFRDRLLALKAASAGKGKGDAGSEDPGVRGLHAPLAQPPVEETVHVAEPVAEGSGRRSVKLKVLQARPAPRIRVPPLPQARDGPRQVTVIDHDDAGHPFIRSLVETATTKPDDPYYIHNRRTVTIHCTRKLEFSIALVACHHYCKAPCPEHIAKLAETGWSQDLDNMPPSATTASTARKKKGGDDEA